jgi:hypothetical protein
MSIKYTGAAHPVVSHNSNGPCVFTWGLLSGMFSKAVKIEDYLPYAVVSAASVYRKEILLVEMF